MSTLDDLERVEREIRVPTHALLSDDLILWADTIAAFVREQREREWQPIETAPKNRPVLVYWRQAGNGIARQTIATYYPHGSLEMQDDYLRDVEDGDEFAPEGWYEDPWESEYALPLTENPLGWMPLPEPPKENTNG